MPDGKNRQILLAARPVGEPKPSDFRMVETAIPTAGPGQVLARTIFLSLDPYMRGRMNAGKSYVRHLEIGEVMTGGAVSQVQASNDPRFKPGDIVEGRTGWQDYAAVDAGEVRRIAPDLAPISTAVGILGMPGMTAYTGLLNIGQPKAGETVVVGAASGAVGAAVGQIARIKGARAVGIAGGPDKCAHVKRDLGFDECLDHRAPGFAEALSKACPKGIDVYFENVGGPVFEAVLPLLNPFSRVPVCGIIAHYNATELPAGPNKVPVLMRAVLSNRITIRGFIVFDYADQQDEFLRTMSGWIREGRVKYREDVVDGLENAVEAFRGLLRGRNFGKLVVRVSPDPTAAAR
ncbi:MAG: NADP-dependent oxidoreductase [Alphaproteobacteria bacterium]|nr:NADP-dependent oxidoreductase [Alphaproteobacteria bacterium]